MVRWSCLEVSFQVVTGLRDPPLRTGLVPRPIGLVSWCAETARGHGAQIFGGSAPPLRVSCPQTLLEIRPGCYERVHSIGADVVARHPPLPRRRSGVCHQAPTVLRPGREDPELLARVDAEVWMGVGRERLRVSSLEWEDDGHPGSLVAPSGKNGGWR